MALTHNPFGWIEIPVSDMERAIKFYETVLDLKMERHTMENLDMAWFPMFEGAKGAAGSLVKSADYTPSEKGALVYITSPSGTITEELERVEAVGGKVLQPRTPIGEWGFMGLMIDSEGNRIALHSNK